jgi:RHS repeat-associated protein
LQLEDWLGTRRVQTDIAGNTEETYTSLPFGDGFGAAVSTGAPPTADDATENHFTGKERDSESGNDYFEARYYASSMGRFLSPDWSAKEEPVPYATMDDPQSLNLYSYVRNNPLTRADADGHDPLTLAAVWGGIQTGAAAVETGLVAGASATMAVVVGVGAEIFAPTMAGSHSEIRWELHNKELAKSASSSGDKPSTLAPGPHAGNGTPARSGDRDFTPGERGSVNAEGAAKGCHTCGTTDPGTKNGNFIPDHQPPTALNPAGG